MATISKSPRKVLLVGLETARRSLPLYPHRFAPRKVTPHCTTLQKAAYRLLRDQRVQKRIAAALALQRPKRRVKHAAADSTGLATHHAGRCFIWPTHPTREGKQPGKAVSCRRYGKRMVRVCCATHLILAATASAGPTPGMDQLDPLPDPLKPAGTVERLVADAGFDSAYTHPLLREEHGMLSTIPAAHGRPSKDPATLPVANYRRLMKTRFNVTACRKRPQVQTTMSMPKRNLGDCLPGRTCQSPRRDMLLMVLTGNIAIL